MVEGGKAKNLKICVDFQPTKTGQNITVTDNALGIAQKDFNRAFNLGELPPETDGLSEFGMGLKCAAFWFSTHWKVITRTLDQEEGYLFDVNLEELITKKTDVVKPCRVKTEVGTTVLLLETQKLQGAAKGKLKKMLGSMYRKFLNLGNQENFVEIFVGGEIVNWEEPKALNVAYYKCNPDKDKRNWRRVLGFSWVDSQNITHNVQGVVMLTEWGAGNLWILRRGRVIMGLDEKYYPAPIYPQKQGNGRVKNRLYIEVEDCGLTVSYTKDGIQWLSNDEELFCNALLSAIEKDPDYRFLEQARNYRVAHLEPGRPKEDFKKSLNGGVEQIKRKVKELQDKAEAEAFWGEIITEVEDNSLEIDSFVGPEIQGIRVLPAEWAEKVPFKMYTKKDFVGKFKSAVFPDSVLGIVCVNVRFERCRQLFLDATNDEDNAGVPLFLSMAVALCLTTVTLGEERSTMETVLQEFNKRVGGLL